MLGKPIPGRRITGAEFLGLRRTHCVLETKMRPGVERHEWQERRWERKVGRGPRRFSQNFVMGLDLQCDGQPRKGFEEEKTL